MIKKWFGYFTKNISLLKSSFGTMILKGLGMGIQFFAFPLYIDYFGNQQLAGVWITIISVLTWINLFDFGIGQGLRNSFSIAKESGDIKGARETVSTTYILSFFVVLTLSLVEIFIIKRINTLSIFKLSLELLDENVFKCCLIILVLSVTFQLLINLITYILYSIQKPVWANSMQFISNLLVLLFLFFERIEGDYARRLLIICIVYSVAMNFPCIISSFYLFGHSLKEYAPRFRFVSKQKINCVLQMGGKLFLLQILWLILSKTNEFLILRLGNPQDVIEYQSYNKVFNLVASFVIVAFVPIWSAVTKAQVEGKYKWIKNVISIMLFITVLASLFECVIAIFMQRFLNIWLQEDTFIVNNANVVLVLACNCLFVLHSANTNVSNGMSNFRLQLYMMSIAAVLDIPLSIWFTSLYDSWIGVVVANIVVLLPYEILQIIDTFHKLDRKIRLGNAHD